MTSTLISVIILAMKFKFEQLLSKKEKLNLKDTPIKEVSLDLVKKFENKDWKKIPITESMTTKPKSLEVVPNRRNEGKAMAWPAYYKTVTEGLKNDGKPKGFGELAQTIEGGIQRSPLVKMRPELKSKLDKAQKILDSNPETQNLQLVVVDGYRTLEVQKRLFDAYYSYLVKKAGKEDQKLSEDEKKEYKNMARKMVSEPPELPEELKILKESPPPHSTGGSVDVILVFKDKINTGSDYWLNDAMVPFGAKFDEMMDPIFRDTRSKTTFYEEKAKESPLNLEEQKALEYRRILYNLLLEQGFTNYYTEFWHFDYGNQFNALVAGKKEAKFAFAGGVEENCEIIEDLTAEKKSFQEYVERVGWENAKEVKHHFGL